MVHGVVRMKESRPLRFIFHSVSPLCRVPLVSLIRVANEIFVSHTMTLLGTEYNSKKFKHRVITDHFHLYNMNSGQIFIPS